MLNPIHLQNNINIHAGQSAVPFLLHPVLPLSLLALSSPNIYAQKETLSLQATLNDDIAIRVPPHVSKLWETVAEQ